MIPQNNSNIYPPSRLSGCYELACAANAEKMSKSLGRGTSFSAELFNAVHFGAVASGFCKDNGFMYLSDKYMTLAFRALGVYDKSFVYIGRIGSDGSTVYEPDHKNKRPDALIQMIMQQSGITHFQPCDINGACFYNRLPGTIMHANMYLMVDGRVHGF